MEGKVHYLYRHIRLDKNEPFYIGKGTRKENKEDIRSRYSRAYCRHARNKIWNKIRDKTDYRVDIIYETTDESDVLRKEEYFILLYGRIHKNNGSLSNISPGGEAGNKKPIISNGRKTYLYDLKTKILTGEFSSLAEACRFIKLKPAHVWDGIKNRGNPVVFRRMIVISYGKEWNYSEEKVIIGKNCKKEVSCYNDEGNIVKTFNSCSIAAKEMNLSLNSIVQSSRTLKFKSGGFWWVAGHQKTIEFELVYHNFYKKYFKKVRTI